MSLGRNRVNNLSPVSPIPLAKRLATGVGMLGQPIGSLSQKLMQTPSSPAIFPPRNALPPSPTTPSTLSTSTFALFQQAGITLPSSSLLAPNGRFQGSTPPERLGGLNIPRQPVGRLPLPLPNASSSPSQSMSLPFPPRNMMFQFSSTGATNPKISITSLPTPQQTPSTQATFPATPPSQRGFSSLHSPTTTTVATSPPATSPSPNTRGKK